MPEHDDDGSPGSRAGAGRFGLLAYVVALALTTAGLAAWLIHDGYGIESPWALLLIVVLAAASERGTVQLSANVEVSVVLIPVVLAAVALGPLPALITGAGSMLGDIDRRPARMVVYTLSRALTGGLAGLAAALLLDALGDGLGGIVVATVAAAVTAQTLDAVFAALTLTLRGTGGFRDVARLAPRLALSAAAYVPLVAVLAYAYHQISPWTLVLFLIPAIAAHRLLVLYQRERGLRAEIAAANAHLRRRDAMLQAVGTAAQRFLETTSLDDAVNGMLAQLGDAADADHVSVLETEGGTPLLRYAWSRGREGGPPRTSLDAAGDTSVPIVIGRSGWGTIGFPARVDGREWSAAEVDGLRAAASLLGAAIERERTEQELRSRDERLRQSQKMEAVGRLAGGIAHDFNNLLTVIGGYSQVLLGELEADHPARSDAVAILKASQRAEGLTRQLLTFSRKQVLAPEVLDLNGIVREADGLLRRVLGEDIDLKADLDHRLPRILADPGQVEQIILNLAVNARDAMPRGGELRLRTACVDASGTDDAAALLEVTDTGHGMDDATRERIFEPFFTTKEVGKGTGLGLATVHGIVEQSGGRIEVDSDLGRGTIFRIYFPVSDAEPAPGEPNLLVPERGTETILLVEDEAVLRGLVARILREAGYLVLEAGDAGEALTVSESYPGVIDLLLTDIVMPRTSGHELAEQVTRQRLFARTLLMSGYTRELAGGPADVPSGGFLAKPFTPEGLLQAVRDALDARPYAAHGADL